MLKVTRNNQAEEANVRSNMVAEHVGFKTNQEDRVRIAKARKDLFKYASDKKHKALLRQASPPPIQSNMLIETQSTSMSALLHKSVAYLRMTSAYFKDLLHKGICFQGPSKF